MLLTLYLKLPENSKHPKFTTAIRRIDYRFGWSHTKDRFRNFARYQNSGICFLYGL